MNIRHISKIAVLVAVVLVISVTLLPTTALMANAVVTPSNLQGWQPTTSGTGQAVTFETGPATPPLGVGSVELSVGPNGAGAAQLRHPGYQGTKLADFTTLGYSTYVDQDGSGGQAPYIILQVDLDGDLMTTTDRTLLFFEPVYQTAAFFPSNPQPALALDTWQTWDALNGGWWSTTGVAGANPGTGVKPLSAITALHPNAVIYNSTGPLGGVRIVAGFGAMAWDNFIGNVDAFTIGVNSNNTTYDFEPLVYNFRFIDDSRLLSPGPQYFTNATAGSDVQVRYSLGGFQGSNPYSSPPVSQQVSCFDKSPIGMAQPIQTYPGDPYYSSLYDYYTTIWRTSPTWAGTCRRLTLSFNDGSTQTRDYRFK